ncbi:MAG: tetratricopeptide repeat protein [Elainella sp. C42_A2020_010]|nr:tetratricopeptide repeat protein [Elainella sp. C42_A2020_010]RNJ68786.1 MAG: tetratricopeptide repeat protein [Leptolyngbya sp. IPPAS B-1204]
MSDLHAFTSDSTIPIAPALDAPLFSAPLSQLSGAIVACEQALQDGKDGSQLAAVCQMLGNLLQGLGRFQEAIFWHTTAREPQPNPAVIYANLGRLCTRQQQWQQAIAYYEQAVQIDPDFAIACKHLANLYTQAGQRQQAADYRYRAVTLRPDWATARNQLKLGNLLLEVNRFEQALDCYRRSIELDSNLHQTYYNLAVALTSRERWQEAAAAYQQALTIHPDHADSYYGLCKVAEGQNDTQAAIDYCQRAVELSPTSFAAHHTLATLLLKLNRWEEAAAAYYNGLKINPDFGWSYHNLGYALLKLGKAEEAVTQLQQAIKLLGDSPWSYLHLGDAFSQQGKWDDAIATFLAVIQMQEDLYGVYQKLGYAVRKRVANDIEPAIAQYQQMLSTHQSSPSHPSHQSHQPSSVFYRQVAAKLSDINQMDAAYFFYRLALHLEPNHSDLYSEVEQGWSKREQLHRWMNELRQAIQKKPHNSWLYTQLANHLAEQGEMSEAATVHRQGLALKGWQHVVTKGYSFTRDWFSHNIPVLTEQLQRFVNAKVNALEIGSFEGMSACWLLDYILTHPAARLTCIDPYFQENFDTNIAKTGSPEKIIKLVGHSQDLLATLEPASYDFIYIDGCHWAEQVKQDGVLSWSLLKPGGLMLFDDYEWSDPEYPGQNTKLGVDAFLDSVRSQVEIVHQQYQLIVKKTSA